MIIGAAKGMSAFRTAAPSSFDRVMSRKMESGHFRSSRQAATDGNLWEPIAGGTGSGGGWYRPKRARKLALAALAVAAVPLVARALRD